MPILKTRQTVLFAACSLFVISSARAQDKLPDFEAGPVFSYLRIPSSPPVTQQNQDEVGLRFSYNLKRIVALDAEIDLSPSTTPNSGSSFQGGRLSQGLFGVKSGRRWSKVGVFGKFRPGFVSSSRVITGYSSQPTPATPQFGRRTDPAFDIGGVVEFYLSPRILLRYDAGDTIIHYNQLTLHLPPGQSAVVFGVVRNNFQFSTGLSFRF